MRDKSVVRSSVIPSARYCCSGSLLRLANGSTIIDKRGAVGGFVIDVVVASTVAGSVEGDLVADQPHQPTTARTSTAAATAATTAHGAARRRRGVVDIFAAGNSAIASGRSAKTRTERAMFLTLCSPLSSNGYGSLSLIWSRTTRETQIPPGSDNASSRAATLTPSP